MVIGKSKVVLEVISLAHTTLTLTRNSMPIVMQDEQSKYPNVEESGNKCSELASLSRG
jgi:hypothetical protein